MGMMAVIIVNVVVLALRYDGEPEAWTLFQDTMNEICTVIFTAEAAVKIYAFGPTGYWTTKWNRFDLFIVVTSWVDLALRVSTWGEDMDPVGFRLIRIIRVVGRISRIFKASRKFKSTEILIDTFISALGGLIYVTVLITLILFVFGVIGMNQFGKASAQAPPPHHNQFGSDPEDVTDRLLLITGCAARLYERV